MIERSKKIDYSIVNNVVRLGMSIRKSVEVLKEMGVEISKSQYHRYVESINGGLNLTKPIRKKRIDYEKVEAVRKLNLSLRKSTKLLNEMGVKISKTAYYKYVVQFNPKLNKPQQPPKFSEPKVKKEADKAVKKPNNVTIIIIINNEKGK